MKNATAEEITKQLITRVFPVFGTPQMIRSDNAPYFSSADMLLALEQWGIIIRFSTPYNHNSNGEVERFNRVINEVISVYDAGQYWDVLVPMVVGAYNNQKQTSIAVAQNHLIFTKYRKLEKNFLHFPNYLYDGQRNQQEFDEILRRVRTILMEKYRRNKDTNKKSLFKEGQMVYLKVLDKVGNKKKLVERYKGPFILSEIEELTGNCKLKKRTQKGRMLNDTIRAHIKQLKLVQ